MTTKEVLILQEEYCREALMDFVLTPPTKPLRAFLDKRRKLEAATNNGSSDASGISASGKLSTAEE
jgi:hypothetical protein